MFKTQSYQQVIMKKVSTYRNLFFILFFVISALPLHAKQVSTIAQGSNSREIFILLSLVIIVLFFLTQLFFKRNRRISAKFISDIEIKMEDTEKSILEIQEHSDDLILTKKGLLVQSTENLKKNLKSMQSALDEAHHSAQRNSILLSNISHTLRTNLNDILGFSYLLGNDFAMKEDSELYEYSENIRKSGNSLVHLLNNIIDISRIEANTFNLGKQNCDLAALMNELISEYKPVAKQNGLQVFFQSETVPLFSTDVEALKHILSNLLDNAVKYTENGFVKIIQKTEDEQVVIIIKDTGIGIDKAFQSEIFEPFRRQSLGYSKNTYQGAGLGLPLVKKMLGLMGGNIKLESEKASGTTVTIHIPHTKPISEKAFSRGTKSLAGDKKTVNIQLNHNLARILVIDNDNLNNMLIRKMLPGISHLSFATSREELDAIIKNGGEKGQPFDIVILNIDFIEKKGGIKIRQELQKNNAVFKRAPFVALSDIMDVGLQEKMLKEGFKTYMDKPISKEKLFNTMNSSMS